MTRLIESPKVFLVAQPKVAWTEVMTYLIEVGDRTDTDAVGWTEGKVFNPDGEALVEIGGRLCYRSWVPGANANVTKIREESEEYLGNILKSGHGSVLEHANYSFIFDDVSRVFTHEMVRHRAGVAVSQESMRFVRLTDIPFWFPEWARGDEELMARSIELLTHMEDHQHWMGLHFELDTTVECEKCDGAGRYDANSAGTVVEWQKCDACEGKGRVSKVPFSEKKHKTSFMRRFAPDGVATGMLCTINVRALRHIIYMRTALGAEEEIRIVFDEVARICEREIPNLMQDYSPNEHGEWIPDFLKV